MKILALEFSTDCRSVALIRDGEILGRAEEHGGRTTKAFYCIERAMRDAEIERESVNCIAVGLGPGSYNGVRIAISIAQGWQVARGTKVIGLSTPECLAEQARAIGLRGCVHIAIDAQRAEFYHASFLLDDDTARVASPLRLTTRDQIIRDAGRDLVWCDPALVGEFSNARGVYPDAAVLGRLAIARVNDSDPSAAGLQPIYLRETSFVKAPPPRPVVLD